MKRLLWIGALIAMTTTSLAGETRNVAIVIWNGAEILDWGGPAEARPELAPGQNRRKNGLIWTRWRNRPCPERIEVRWHDTFKTNHDACNTGALT